MSFLNYLGKYTGEKLFRFEFKNNIFYDEPLFIVSPMYDNVFKKIFFQDEQGAILLKDFLNSTLFPQSNKIKSLEFISKTILSKSDLKYNKGSLIVDNACKVKLHGIKDYIILDIEVQISYKQDFQTTKFFDYVAGLRSMNNFMETWVIAFFIDKIKDPYYDKSCYSYIIKNPKESSPSPYDSKSIKIHEIYLNSMMKNISSGEKVFTFDNEEMEEKGKEWIKLFSLDLWCNSYYNDLTNYCIPKNVRYKGEYIKKAILIINDFKGIDKLRFKINRHYQEEVLNKAIEDGIAIKNMENIDYFFNKYTNGNNLENIEILGKVKYDTLINRYNGSVYLDGFINELLKRNLIIK